MVTPPPLPTDLGAEERLQLQHALRVPRGRYTYERASQLSGVPARTLHHWARERVLIPDFNDDRPKMWSYRDLVFIRLFTWLRMNGMTPAQASRRIDHVRTALRDLRGDVSKVRIAGGVFLLGDETFDRVTGQQIFAEVLAYFNVFDLEAPLSAPEFGRSRLWGPDLVRPSRQTAISPWVMGGDPCVKSTRIPTSTLFALTEERGLKPPGILALYPGLWMEAVEDAVTLERRLRKLSEAA
jgi:uncharacterized protein (DUF433 family)/DNA-binding transcriptional MerR regulator